MIEALVFGKLSREQENMEDILTSNVFGLLRLMAPADGLLPFLRIAKLPDGKRPLEQLGDDIDIQLDFWPRFKELDCHSCEPDVVIRISRRGRLMQLVWVEAKYRSGKSSEESLDDDRPNDQLAREWDNLVRVALREHAEPLLIYLTADVGLPEHEIAASKGEFERKRRFDSPFTCAWLSWRDLPVAISSCSALIADNLRMLADRLDLHYFQGIGRIQPLECTYAFTPSFQRFNWGVDAASPTRWRFIS